MKPLLVSLIFVASGFCADKPATPTAPVIPSAPAIDNPRSVVVTERSVVRIYVCQLQDTILALPEKELSRSAHVADGDNWIIRTAGGNQASRFLDIKVRMPLTTETTLNVITDHDSTYTFLLVLGSGHCDSKVFIDADEQMAKHIAETRPWASPEEVDRMKAEID
jgi:hypothetical protein